MLKEQGSEIQKAELEGVSEEKIAFVREEILFPLRQRIMGKA